MTPPRSIGPSLPAGVVLLDSAVSDRGWTIICETLAAAAACEGCSKHQGISYGRYETSAQDLPHRGKPVELKIRRRRFHCRHCRKTYSERLPFLEQGAEVTARLAQHLRDSASTLTNVAQAASAGLSEGSVRNILRANRERPSG